jgi:PAS domain S-box-containing protein
LVPHEYFRAGNASNFNPRKIREREQQGGRFLEEIQHRKIISLLQETQSGLSTDEIAKRLGLSRTTATKYLNSLVVSGQVNRRKAGPAKIYSLSARLPAKEILSRLPDRVLVLDDTYTVREVSDSFLATFEVTRDQVEGRDVTGTVIGPGLVDRIRDPVKQGMAGIDAAVNAWVPVQKEWKSFHIRIVPLVFDWGGNGVVIMLEDRTGEVMAQEENALLASLLNIAPAAITVMDFSGRHLYSNQVNLDLHGYSAGEFLKLNIRDLDTPASAKKIDERMKALREAGELTFEVVHVHKNGTRIPLEIHTSVATWGGREVIICIATDISGRIEAERALRESEETFRAMVEQSVEGIIIVDFSGNVRFANRRALDIAECPPDLMMTETFNVFDLISREFQENAVRDLHQISRGIDSYEVFYKFLTLGQSEKWVACIGKKISFRGTPAVLISFRDVTERKQAEEELRESEQKFSALFENNPVPLTLASAQTGRFVDVNDAFLQDTGFTRREVIGKTATQLGLFADPVAYAKLVARLRDRKIVQAWEMACRVKNGGIRTCLFSSKMILMDGRPHIISTIENITERKAAESAFQTMVSSMIGTSGVESLDRITENLASWLKADCVMIGEILPGRDRVEVRSMLLDGKRIPEFSYSLKGTPCENAAEKGFCVYSDEVAKTFPGSRDLQEFGIRGYAGTPLRDYDGGIVGIICVMTREPLVLPPSAKEIIDIIAVKAAAGIRDRRLPETAGKKEVSAGRRTSRQRGHCPRGP